MGDEATIKNNIDVSLEPMMAKALVRAFDGYRISSAIEAVVADSFAKDFKSVLEELSPKIQSAMKDALIADLGRMTKAFVKNMRESI